MLHFLQTHPLILIKIILEVYNNKIILYTKLSLDSEIDFYYYNILLVFICVELAFENFPLFLIKFI